MEAIGISSGYPPKTVYLVWEKPYEVNNGQIMYYSIYRDGQLIIFSPDEEGKEVFQSPTMFDHDHHTNLFKKDSTHKLMFVDNEVNTYQEYEYYVEMRRTDADGKVLDVIKSNPVYITVH